jgi:hypothetical protein
MQFFGDRIRLPGGKLDRHIGAADDPEATTRLVATLYLSRSAVRVMPVEALRYE